MQKAIQSGDEYILKLDEVEDMESGNQSTNSVI